MKRTLSLLMACMLAILACSGCKTAETSAPAATAAPTAVPKRFEGDVFAAITGLDPEMTVLSADGVTVPLALYCYWQVYNASLMEYRVYTYAETSEEFKSIMGTGTAGYLNWDAPFGGFDTLRAYLNQQTADTVRQYMALEIIARENGLVLEDDDLKALEAERQELVTSLGGEEAFDSYIAEMGLTRANFDRVSAYGVWFDKLLTLMETPGSPLYMDVDALSEYGLFTDHIYLAKVELSNYTALSDDVIAAKRQRAEELLGQIAAAEDPAAAFTALADQYSEDPYRSSYPDGYVFAPGAMNAAYEAAAKALKVNEISGVVEGETGFYLILRKDLHEKLQADPDRMADLRHDYLTDLIVSGAEQMEITAAPELAQLDVAAIYTAFVKLMNG